MKKINENDLAKAIAAKEGKKHELSIGQIKEVLKIALDHLALCPTVSVFELIAKHGPKDAPPRRFGN